MQRLIIILILSVCLIACSEQATDPATNSTASSTAVIQVIDFSGATVALSKPAERVVALAPHIAENVFTAGAGDKLVGVVAHSDYPEQVKSLPLVGGYAKTNLEKILELNPDLVIAWESGNSNASIARIKQLGYPVYIDQPDTLTDIAKSIRDIGTLTGHAEQADNAVTGYLAKINLIKQRHRSAESITTFYQVWNSPLQTINGNHIISDAMELCGGVNIYADEPAVAPIINIESILERNPQAIIASGMSKARPEWLDDWQKWPSLTAVANDNLFFVNPDHIQRHTVRLLLGIESICSQLELARQRAAQP